VESEILETDNGDYFALKTDTIQAPQTPTLADIHDKVLEAWKANKRNEILQGFADEITKALKNGENPNDIAKRYKGAKVEGALLHRAQESPPLSPRHIGQIFSISEGEVAMAPDQSGKNIIIARLENILPAGTPTPTVLAQGQSVIGEAMAADLQAQFVKGLLDQYTVKQDNRLKALALGDNPDS